MKDLLKEIYNTGIVPVVVLDTAEQALPVAKALLAGGINCAEVTYRTEAAEQAIKIISKELPQMLLGAGTVLTTTQVDGAMAAGAKFIVSPGLNPKVVKYCMDKKIPVIPGCANPCDIEQAIELGLDTVKFFPAEAAGGIKMIKALSAPYPKMKFMPTGGINIKNLNDYLAFDKVIACGGSWMVDKAIINSGDWAKITALSKEAVAAMHNFKVEHVGINNPDAATAERVTDTFCQFFGVPKIESQNNFFAGDLVEVMKTPFWGAHGHIAVLANNADRAYYHLKLNGAEFNMQTENRDPKTGKLKTIYLKDDIGGFAVHLKQRPL